MAKDALQKIDAKKRDRIFRNAAAEFARCGYHKANVNVIAQRAGIGKGSIYLYFADKLDLYYSTFREAVRIQEKLFDSIEGMALDPLVKIEKLFDESLKIFPQYRGMFKMYFDLSTSGDERSLVDLAQLLEKRSARFFTAILKNGIREGRIRKDLPLRYAAYVLDCIYSTFFSSLACSYQGERFRVFTRQELSQNGDNIKQHVNQILNVLGTGINAPGDTRGNHSSR
ncbi:MAG: TetR/AcrR family transcriptional regulator [Candidatus Abyssobacteria bacterium SURF_5]|uniref:TetR/AcrR family transcriptional regulator n=1 Tax=Abyssobacteria bacterium (strain SURF_5) TaxID=2093360 RepID=A0A3A4NNY5_ABYX5|nr:MAG: TetR/AcrR family transcriptional regulator [Candidatus Abyssubacteria bacterium SURF_5]